MTIVIAKNVQSIHKWWVLDLKNGLRSDEENLEHKTLSEKLIAECGFRDETHLRMIAVGIITDTLRGIR